MSVGGGRSRGRGGGEVLINLNVSMEETYQARSQRWYILYSLKIYNAAFAILVGRTFVNCW